jgi:hypothetical protein
MDYEIHDSVHDHAPEHKSGIASAPRGEHEQILQMFEEFKAAPGFARPPRRRAAGRESRSH